MENYYEVLGVTKDISANELKKVFRKLARKYHPDSNPNDEKAAEMFKRIGEAYETLGDETKRKEYDEKYFANGVFNANVSQKGQQGKRPQGAKAASSVNEQIFNQFNNIFGNFNKAASKQDDKQDKSKNPMDFSSAFEQFYGMSKDNWR